MSRTGEWSLVSGTAAPCNKGWGHACFLHAARAFRVIAAQRVYEQAIRLQGLKAIAGGLADPTIVRWTSA
jgi:hypothetical protein